MKTIIQAKNITKTFGKGEGKTQILKGIDIDIKEREFVSIMGPSGCGKSTLLYILGGLDMPTSGKVLINDKDINTMKDKEKSKLRRSGIGFVFQFYNLVQNLNVEDNILLPIVMGGGKARRYKKELAEILEIVGLDGHRKYLPSQLSGGQQQRVAIARAVISNPEIILADEPVGNLDSHSSTTVMELFKRINEEKGITILQVTHSEANAAYGHRIIRLSDGLVVQ